MQKHTTMNHEFRAQLFEHEVYLNACKLLVRKTISNPLRIAFGNLICWFPQLLCKSRGLIFQPYGMSKARGQDLPTAATRQRSEHKKNKIIINYQYEKLRENQVRYRETVSLQHLKDPIATQDFASWFAILKGNLQPSWHMNWEVHHCPYPEKISASAISVLGLDFELGLFQLYLLDRAGNTTSLQSNLFSFLNLLGDF